MQKTVFLTGATGFIGGAVARALVQRGHRVLALARASRIPALPAGVTPLPGDLRRPDGWREALRRCDCAIHAAYEYDTQGREVAAADEMAVAELGEAVRRGDCHAVHTSNAFLLDGIVLSETERLPASLVAGVPRLAREQSMHDAGAAVIRVGLVYGGRGGSMGMLLDALAGGERDGLEGLENRWSLIHLADLAALYCTVAERRLHGTFHGVDGMPLRVGDVVAAAAAALDRLGARGDAAVAARAAALLRGYRAVLGRDIVLATGRARQAGWQPRHPSFLAGAEHAAAEWLMNRRAECDAC